MQLKKTLILLAALYFSPFLFLGPLLCPRHAALAVEDVAPSVGNSVVLTEEDEPGEPMRVVGTVFGKDGKTPQPDVEIYVYHTDSQGYYSPGSTRADKPRIYGRVRTDAQGRYELLSIRPGAYPSAGIPAHIHFVITDDDGEQRFEVQFADDPLLRPESIQKAQKQGRFATIQPITRDVQGIWQCVRDFRITR